MDWYKRYIGDYARDTAHLRMLQHGAYQLLMDHYYATERPLTLNLDDLYHTMRAAKKEEQAAINVALDQFFTKTEEGYRNKRIDSEIEKYRKRQAINKRNAERIESESLPESVSNTRNQKPETRNQSPDTNNQTPKKDIGQSAFDRFWEEYPQKVKKKQAQEIWKRKKLDIKADLIISDVEKRLALDARWKGGFIPDPTTYLNGERWNDEISEKQHEDSQRTSQSSSATSNAARMWDSCKDSL